MTIIVSASATLICVLCAGVCYWAMKAIGSDVKNVIQAINDLEAEGEK